MAYARSAVRLFQLANRAYAGALVSFYTVDPTTQIRTNTLATLYAQPLGVTTLANPVRLDADGKVPAPVYIETPVVAVTSGAIEDHETGIVSPVSAHWRGDWADAQLYYPDDIVRDGALGTNSKDIYICLAQHTSASFATDFDVAAGKWALFIDVDTVLVPPGALTVPIQIADGGTGSSTAATARTALGVPGIPVPIAEGGTGSTTAANARAALGVAGLPVTIGEGGTGQTSAAAARTALAVAGLADANVFTATQTFQLTDTGAGAGPNLDLMRESGTPAASDYIGQIRFRGRDSAANAETYAAIVAQILDTTNTSEDSLIEFHTIVAGTLAKRAWLGQGLVVGNATGGDPGAGSVNIAGGLRVNNVVQTFVTDGAVVAQTMSSLSAVVAIAAAIPLDDTAPQNTEGTEFLTHNHTPKATTNLLRIQVAVQFSKSNVGVAFVVGLWKDSEASARAAVVEDGSEFDTLHLQYEMTAGTTSPITFKLRAGMATGTGYVNADTAGTRIFGTLPKTTIIVTEVKAS